MRLIHTADWQIGKPFGRFGPEVRSALAEARFDAIDRIGRVAADRGVDHVVVAGDVFDNVGPSDRDLVQALTRMSRARCRWWLLPGNHDNVRAGGLWDRVRRKASENVIVLDRPEPVAMTDEAWLLPAPIEYRRTRDDPTAAFSDMVTPANALRIGLAHGSIVDFAQKGEAENLIPPDRARISGLDYLALGDWHGHLMVGDRTSYSGVPEIDRFGRDGKGSVSVVEVLYGSPPAIERVETGRYEWLERRWELSDAAAFHDQRRRLMQETDPANTLLRLKLSGILDISDRSKVMAEAEDDLAHALRWCDVDDADLAARPSDRDIEELAIEGTLQVASRLLQADCAAGGAQGALAAKALERLYVETLRAGDPE